MKPLTKDEILYVAERPHGFKHIFDFCKAVNEGKSPDSETQKLIAESLWLILTEPDHDLQFGLSLFAEKLGLKSIRGEKPNGISLEQSMEIGAAVLEYQERVQAGRSKIPASDFVAAKYGKSGKTIRTWARIYKSDVEDYESAIKAARQFYARIEARQKNK